MAKTAKKAPKLVKVKAAKGKAKKVEALEVSRDDAVKLFKAVKYPTADSWPESKLQTKLGKIDQMIDEGTKPKDKKLRALLMSVLTAIGADQDIVVLAGKKGKAAPSPAKAGKGKKGKVEDEDEDEDEIEEDDEEEEDEDEEDEDSDDDDDDDSEDEDEDDDEGDDEEDDEEEEEDVEEEEDEDEEDEDDEEEDEDSDDEDDDSEDEEDDEDEEDESDEDDDEDSDDEDDDVEEAKTKSKKKGGKNGSPVGKPAKSKDGKSGLGVIATCVEMLANASAAKPVSKDAIIKALVKKFGKPEAAVRSTINTQLPNRLKVDKGLDIKKNESGYWIDPKKNSKALKELGISVKK